MDKTAVGLLGAIAGLATLGSAHAATNPAPDLSEALHASSYADLLEPVPDAVTLLKADDAARAQQSQPGAVEEVQYYYNGYPNPYPYASPYYSYYPPVYAYPPYPYYHHHHHHHHYHHHHHHHNHYYGR